MSIARLKAGDVVIAKDDVPGFGCRPEVVRGNTYLVERIKDDHWVYLPGTQEGWGLAPTSFRLTETETSRRFFASMWLDDELWEHPIGA